MYHVGDRVHFWTGRGSQGYAVIREIKGERLFLDPDPDAIKGSDYRHMKTDPPSTRWAPRDLGVLEDQINTPPRSWYTNF